MSSAVQFTDELENSAFLGSFCPTGNIFMFKFSGWGWRIEKVPFQSFLNDF